MSKPFKKPDRFSLLGRSFDVTQTAPDSLLSVPSIGSFLSQPSAPPTPNVNIFGYWKGSSGSILRFEKASGTAAGIKVTGTALDQKVEGTGSIEGYRLKLRLTLQVKRIELTVDLAMPRDGEFEYEADEMSGTASDADGTQRSVKLSRMATDIQGTWREGSESSLSLAEPVLDWYDGEQQVRVNVTGYIFGRSGKGTLKNWGRNLTGSLKATDFSHYNRYVDEHLWARDHEKSYKRDCPKEGWWASDTLYLSLKMCSDGSFLAGTVSPLGRLDDSDIEAHVQLARGTSTSTARTYRSYL